MITVLKDWLQPGDTLGGGELVYVSHVFCGRIGLDKNRHFRDTIIINRHMYLYKFTTVAVELKIPREIR